MSQPPKAYTEFTETFPKLREAWDAIGEAGQDGPLDAKTQRLIKLGIAIGARMEGPTHASVRKAKKLNITREEMMQVVALASGTIGMPASVAAMCWVDETL